MLVKTQNGEIYHRVDLVRILEGSGYLTNPEKELTIGGLSKLEKEAKQHLETQARIEVPPKNNIW